MSLLYFDPNISPLLTAVLVKMRKICLISCVKSKLSFAAKAKDIYVSPLFRLNFQYALLQKPDAIFILSAKYGLLDPDQIIEPYEMTLNKMSVAENKSWAKRVLFNLEQKTDLKANLFILLAGKKYRQFLLSELAHYSIPFEGYSFGRQLHELKERINEQLL